MIDTKNLKSIIKNSSLPILVIGTQQFEKGIEILANTLPSFGCLISNFDQKQESQLVKNSIAFKITYGFDNGAKMQATDFHPSPRGDISGTSFKLNFRGNILPIWIPHPFGKKSIYATLVILSVCQVFNLNLVDVSRTLKSWQL